MSGPNLKPNGLFWILAVVFLLWNIMGCSMYLVEMTMSDEAYAQSFGAEVAAVRGDFPIWGIVGYAIAVWSGLLAAILFLLRKKLSVSVFLFSLIMAIIGFIPSFTNSILREAYGPQFWVMPLIVVLLGIFEVWYSRRMLKASDVSLAFS